MNPLDTLIKQHVVPVMKAAGFTKKGRIFRRAAPNGDHVFLHIDANLVDPDKFVFEVSFWMVPLPNWEFAYRNLPKTLTPNASGALATCKVIPPDVAAHQPEEEGYFRSRWAFAEPDTRDLCGRELARVLAEDAVPWMVRLLDRRTLLAETRTNPNGELVRLGNDTTSEILLRIDDDPIGDVSALVDKAEADGAFPPFVDWARIRLARRAAEEV
ncbi:DUF4304 domain-containing protein [Streptomyces shenzhenensis]|uniref:DUF4304 domain-containing protein n=1 Tax=Streptomyces shenzhenensis TaxID=943815 RepID=UPI0015F07D4A|nr:DUF4304 domain-containing protein [Streptomyces shenzhenensis]